LYQALAVLLTVLQLLIAVTLDSLEQGGKGQLLVVTKLGFFLLQHRLHLNH
jgi:hypothetical protein